MSPITMTTSALTNAAVHQLPTVVGQPKQYAQVLNGPATTAKMTNGTHIEIKKDISDAVQGTDITPVLFWRCQSVLVCFSVVVLLSVTGVG